MNKQIKIFLIIIALAVVAIPIVWSFNLCIARSIGWAACTGLGEFVSPALGQGQEYIPGKTLWDWLELLIIPIVLAGGALLFNWSERRAEREIAKDRDQTERELAGDRIRESALQAYLDRMTELLLEKNLRHSEPDTDAAAVARVRTLTLLRGLDGERKGAVVRFLYEAHLIDNERVVVKLSGADLIKADLNKADLRGADLSEAFLALANLNDTNLIDANLRGAHLDSASLEGAKLSLADLRYTSLIKANLKKSDLRGSNLYMATLIEADLSGADLSGALVVLFKLHFEQPILDEKTIMPDGSNFLQPPIKTHQEDRQ